MDSRNLSLAPAPKVDFCKLLDNQSKMNRLHTAALVHAGSGNKLPGRRSELTREQWLLGLVEYLAPLFNHHGYSIPANIRVSCSLPSGRAFSNNRTIGECWATEASADQTHEIMVSHTVANSLRAGGVLVHEVCHAVAGIKAGHGKLFRRLAIAVGLEGKMTATGETDYLNGMICSYAWEVGEYPHAKLDYSKRKKQPTRLLKAVCNNLDCDFFAELGKTYSVRLSSQVFDYAAPRCGSCGSEMEAE